MDWKTIGQLAGLLGSIKIAHLGTQNHKFDLKRIKELYEKSYGEPLTNK
jgi:adenosine kinase